MCNSMQLSGTLMTQDGLGLHLTRWEPDASSRAVVYLIHGLGDHSGRYTHVAEALSEARISCWALDLRGHGKSDGARGHTPSLGRLLDDVSLMVQENTQAKPAFLYGHSLGAAIALEFGRLRPEGLSGVIGTGPWLRLRFSPPGYKLVLAKLLPKVIPALALPNGLDVDAISRDRTIVKSYVNDPLVHDRITTQLGASMLSLGAELLAQAGTFHLPLLLIHGEADRLTDPSATRAFFEGAGSVDKTLKIWPGLFHEVHNEPEKAEVISSIISWIEERIRTGPTSRF